MQDLQLPLNTARKSAAADYSAPTKGVTHGAVL